MKRLIAMLGCVVVVAAGPALAQATKTLKGSVKEVGANTITVSVAGKDMTFNVDAKTTVVAHGGGTKAKAAEAAGKTGPGIAEVLKAGEPVEVAYHEAGMHADTVKVIPSVPPPPPPAAKEAEDQKTKATTESGVVSAVTGNSLTVKGKAGETTFTVDGKTVVSGSGFGSAGQKITDAGGKVTLSEFVHTGDSVTVTYHDTGVAKMASKVHVTKKALK